MEDKKYLGRRGEDLAKEYLRRNGYEIKAANYRAGHKEIDLIAARSGQTVCFEIKTRTDDNLAPEECLTARQTGRLKSALRSYCYENRLDSETVRGDLIIITINRKKSTAEIRHYLRAF